MVWAAVALLATASCGADEADPTTLDLVESALSYESQSALASSLEDHLTDCMAAEGWEYWPNPVPSESEFERNNRGLLTFYRQLDEADVERNGYGVVDSFGSLFDEQSIDRNSEFFLSLTQLEQSAYLESLGELGQGDGALRKSGCIGEAYDNLPTGSQQDMLTMSALTEFTVNLATSEEILDGVDAWALCMEKEGLSFRSPEEPRLAIIERVEAAVASSDVSPPFGELPDELEQELAAIRTDEVLYAVTDATCRNLHLDALVVDAVRDFELPET